MAYMHIVGTKHVLTSECANRFRSVWKTVQGVLLMKLLSHQCSYFPTTLPYLSKKIDEMNVRVGDLLGVNEFWGRN